MTWDASKGPDMSGNAVKEGMGDALKVGLPVVLLLVLLARKKK